MIILITLYIIQIIIILAIQVNSTIDEEPFFSIKMFLINLLVPFAPLVYAIYFLFKKMHELRGWK